MFTSELNGVSMKGDVLNEFSPCVVGLIWLWYWSVTYKWLKFSVCFMMHNVLKTYGAVWVWLLVFWTFTLGRGECSASRPRHYTLWGAWIGAELVAKMGLVMEVYMDPASPQSATVGQHTLQQIEIKHSLQTGKLRVRYPMRWFF
jgi:hypothetical protein